VIKTFVNPPHFSSTNFQERNYFGYATSERKIWNRDIIGKSEDQVIMKPNPIFLQIQEDNYKIAIDFLIFLWIIYHSKIR